MKPVIIVLAVALFLPTQGRIVAKEITVPDKPRLGWQSGDAADQGQQIATNVENVLLEQTKANFKVYWSSGEKFNWITVYEITDPSIWEKIIELLSAKRRQTGWNPIYIEFLEREIWIRTNNNTQKRGGEKILRTKVVE